MDYLRRTPKLRNWKGPARGINISSFWAESYGCLSVHRFLVRYSEYKRIDTIRCKITFYCYNLGLIKRINRQEDPKILKPPRQTLKSDCDIVNAIITTRQGTSYKIQTEHVRGHQDEVHDHVLTRPEELNTIADQ
jgi:hypothetical protein